MTDNERKLITDPTDYFDPDRLRALLDGSPLVRHVIPFARINSTNSWALAQARRTPRQAAGLLVTTEEQTAGRGRFDRTWHAAPSSSLLFSLVTFAPLRPSRLTFAAPLSITTTINELLPPDTPRAVIKWPNDILIAGRKVAGILIEHPALPKNASALVVIGIGVNVRQTLDDFPAHLRDSATSIRIAAGALPYLTREEILAKIIYAIAEIMTQPINDLCDQYNAACETIGKVVTLPDGRTGTVLRINAEGVLELQPANPNDSIIYVRGGEITYRPDNLQNR